MQKKEWQANSRKGGSLPEKIQDLEEDLRELQRLSRQLTYCWQGQAKQAFQDLEEDILEELNVGVGNLKQLVAEGEGGSHADR